MNDTVAARQHTDPTPAARRSRRLGLSRRLVLAALTVLVLAAAGSTTYLAFRPSRPNLVPTVSEDGVYTPGSLSTAGATAAVASAAQAVPTLLSYDYRTLNDTIAHARPFLAPAFVQEYEQTFEDSVVPVAAEKHAVTKAMVRAAGLIDISGEKARCLVFVDQVLVSTTMGDLATASAPNAGPAAPTRIAQSRVQVSLSELEGKWLITGLAPL